MTQTRPSLLIQYFNKISAVILCSLLFAISPKFTLAQFSSCPADNNNAPTFSPADALNPNYGATLEIQAASLTNGLPSFCVDNDPSDGKATEGGCATFLFTALPNEDSCQAGLFFRPREGCSTIGDPPRNICLWQEDPNNPGQWKSIGSVANEILGDAYLTIPAGATEFAITLCGPNATSSVLLWSVQLDFQSVDIGPDTTLCVLDVPLSIDLTLHEPLVGGPFGQPQTGGRWEELGVGTIATPDNYPISGSLGDSFSFIYSYEDLQTPNCIVKDTIVYAITNDCPGVPQVNVSGTSRTWMGESINNVAYTALNANEQTTGSPDYLITLFSGGDEDIKAERNTDPIPLIGITTLDILLTRAHILQNPLLSSPYQLLAADVNASGNISTVDYLQMQAMILQNISAFQPGNRLWSFLSSDYSFSDPANPWNYDPLRHYTPLSSPNKTNQDFIGVKLGDVNGNWTAANGNRTAGTTEQIFALENYTTESGSRIRVPIIASTFEKLKGYQFTLEWDPEALHFEQVIPQTLSGEFGYKDTERGYLSSLWYDPQDQAISLNPGQIVYEVEFTVLGKNGTHSPMSIGSASIPAEAYTEQFSVLIPTPVSARIQIGQTTDLDEQFEGYTFGPAIPNPFSHKTKLPFTLSKREIVNVSVYNSFGQWVWSHEQEYTAGSHEITWESKDIQGRNLSPGMYHVIFKTGAGSSHLRLVVGE